MFKLYTSHWLGALALCNYVSVPGLVLGCSKRCDWLDNKELTWEVGDMVMYSWMSELAQVSFPLFLTFF